MEFDILANKYPALTDLMGIASQLVNADGLKRLVDWYLANRDWAKDVETP